MSLGYHEDFLSVAIPRDTADAILLLKRLRQRSA
jgi:hypothetical protein